MSYDSKCYDLAIHFLDDAGMFWDKDAQELAQLIQNTIEAWIEDKNGDREPPEPDGEAFRGGEAQAYFAEQMVKWQKLK
jgi:hypothetical protein